MTHLFDVLQATWPPAAAHYVGPWQVCEGRGGGQRVSAARLVSDFKPEDIDAAEAEMRTRNQHPLFLIRSGEYALDTALADRGYTISDPTVLMNSPIAPLAQAEIPPVTAFPIWPPLQIMHDIWHEAGMDRARFDVMDRVTGVKTSILGRINARPAGVVFAAISDATVMVHALEIDPDQRRHGLASHLMRAAAQWGVEHDATEIALAVVRGNAPAIALYQSLGMTEIGGYHYRKAP